MRWVWRLCRRAPAEGPADVLVERYRGYLLDERGLAAGTVRYYERVARLFLGRSLRRVASWIWGG